MIIPLKTVHSFGKVSAEHLKNTTAQRLWQWDFLDNWIFLLVVLGDFLSLCGLQYAVTIPSDICCTCFSKTHKFTSSSWYPDSSWTTWSSMAFIVKEQAMKYRLVLRNASKDSIETRINVQVTVKGLLKWPQTAQTLSLSLHMDLNSDSASLSFSKRRKPTVLLSSELICLEKV